MLFNRNFKSCTKNQINSQNTRYIQPQNNHYFQKYLSLGSSVQQVYNQRPISNIHPKSLIQMPTSSISSKYIDTYKRVNSKNIKKIY